MKLNNETEIPEDQLEEYALKLSAKDFACRSKAKATPQRRELAGSSPRIVPIESRNWIEIDPVKYSRRIRRIEETDLSSLSFTSSSKKKRMERFISG